MQRSGLAILGRPPGDRDVGVSHPARFAHVDAAPSLARHRSCGMTATGAAYVFMLAWHRPGASTRPWRIRMRAVTYAGAGGNEVVSLSERPDPAPTAHEVLIAARFAGLNWADIAQRNGFYPAPPGSPQDIPGLEMAGTVVAAGEAVRAWSIGNRVFGLVGGGGLADRVIAHERHLAAIPEGMADDVAAT